MHLSLDEETAVKKRCPDDYGFTVRFHRHCGEGWGTGVSANVPHGGTHDEEKIRESYESGILAMVKSNNRIIRKEMAENLSISLRSLQRIIFKGLLMRWMNYITLEAEITDIGRSSMINIDFAQGD